MTARCTASGQVRSGWSPRAWTTGEGICPDCGSKVEVFVRGFDLFPAAKARAHKAPPGVTPGPFAFSPRGGYNPDEAKP